MAKSSSSTVPGDVEWLPGPGGSRVLRIHPASPEPPALMLRSADGTEVRVEARPGPDTEYDIPSELDWSTAWLQWPDGTRATVPAPHGGHAQVIELRPRRDRAAGGDASTVGAIAAGEGATSQDAERSEARAAGATAAGGAAAGATRLLRGPAARRPWGATKLLWRHRARPRRGPLDDSAASGRARRCRGRGALAVPDRRPRARARRRRGRDRAGPGG